MNDQEMKVHGSQIYSELSMKESSQKCCTQWRLRRLREAQGVYTRVSQPQSYRRLGADETGECAL